MARFRNVSTGNLSISDITSQTSNARRATTLQPLGEITIYDADAERSSDIAAALAAGHIIKVGNETPPSGVGIMNSDEFGWVAAPASDTAAGVAGQRAYDASYLYVCVATNTWRRSAIAAGW